MFRSVQSANAMMAALDASQRLAKAYPKEEPAVTSDADEHSEHLSRAERRKLKLQRRRQEARIRMMVLRVDRPTQSEDADG